MSSFNKVYLLGNLTRDPEPRDLPSGTKLASFGLAVNRSYRKADGEEVEETTFVDIDAFGRTAENILKYCKKGDPLMVEGRLRFQSWETDAGDKRSKLTVLLETFTFSNNPDSSHALKTPRPTYADKSTSPLVPSS